MTVPPLGMGRSKGHSNPKKSGSKFGNIKTEIITSGKPVIYDSRKEARVGQQLHYRQAAGQINELKRQVAFKFELNGILICKYIVDFTYMENGKLIVVDVKGYQTREYKIKRKMMLAFHGIKIIEVFA